MTDPSGHKTTFVRDGLGRVTASRITGGALTNAPLVDVGYDLNGNVNRVVPPDSGAHSLVSNALDLLTTYSPPDAGLDANDTTYADDRQKQVLKVSFPFTDVLKSLLYGRDGAGRLNHMFDTSAGVDIATSYDGTTGLVTSVASRGAAAGDVTLAFTYAGTLPVKSTMTLASLSPEVRWSYDHWLRQAKRSVKSGDTGQSQTLFPEQWSFDADGMVTQLRPRYASDASDMTVLTLTRDPRGLGLVQSSGNTTTTAVQSSVDEVLGYNGFAEISRYEAKTGASTWLRINRPADAANGLLRDSLGRVTSREDTIAAAGGLAAATTRWDYTYDDRGRLATASKNSGAATTYTYDPNGNRTGPTVAHYGPQDRMTDLGGVARTYTNNGSLATRGAEAFTYHLSGNLRKWVSGGTTIEYLIDGQNRRVGKKRNGTLETIWFYDDQLRLAAQLNGAGHVRQVFYYSGQSRTPELVFQPDATPAVSGGGRWFRLVSDLNGSLRLVLDISGTTPTVRQRADYDAWGVVTGEWVDTTGGYERVPFGFAAGLLDTDTGLVRFGARDYEPAAGRWTGKDPNLFAGGLNLYAYADDDSVNEVDPSGLAPENACVDKPRDPDACKDCK